MPGILINECKQEISSFNPVLSGDEDFLIGQGADLLDFHRTMRNEVGGALSVFDASPGPTAVLEAGSNTIVISTRPVSLYDRTLFLANGQHPESFDMTVVKSPLCQPRFFDEGAELRLDIDAPGSTSANLRSLGHAQAPRPLYPLEAEMSYQPSARVFGGAR